MSLIKPSSLPKPLGSFIPKLASPVFRKRGFADMNLIQDWSVIMGSRWASLTFPEKLIFPPHQRQNGTLYIRVRGSPAVLLQHIAPEIVSRINTYFGYKAVAHLKMLQGFSAPHDSVSLSQSLQAKEENETKHSKTFQKILLELEDLSAGPLKDTLIQFGLALHKS